MLEFAFLQSKLEARAVPTMIIITWVFLILTIAQTYSFSINGRSVPLQRSSLSPHPPETPSKRLSTGRFHSRQQLASTSSAGPTNDALIIDQALDSALGLLQNAEVSSGKSQRFQNEDFDMFEIYADSPELAIPHELIAELEEREAKELSDRLLSSGELNTERIRSGIAKWRKHESDVGSSEVQVVIADEKIKYLTKHLLANRKDLSAKRGLQALVVTRRKFLDYLSRTDPDKARLMVQELGIRFRTTGQEWDKVAKYGAFTNTKAKYVKGADGRKRRIKK